jgi:heme-degrading monooxygenase HmoA
VIVRIVRFRSRLSDAEVRSSFEARSSRYREVPGLRQKYYLRFPGTGEHGAVYVWDSQEALDRFLSSDLARSIPAVYQVDGTSRSEIAEVVLALRAEAGAAAR